MKNLMIFIGHTSSFDDPRSYIPSDESEKLAKVQIDNSLQLGWKVQDIMLITNFNWRYGKVRAKVLKDVMFFAQNPQTSKINAIVKLFEKRIIKPNQLYWFHDLDAFQLQKITESEIKMGKADMALTDYGKMPRWSTGSIFFKKSSKDIFNNIKKIVYKEIIDEERALSILTKNDKDIRKRVKKINKTYNFTAPNLRSCYRMAKKPIRVAHFHPLVENRQLGIKKPLDFFKGNNKLQQPLITKRLVKIFKYHRIV